MQEHRWDGTTAETERATLDDVRRAMADRRNRAVTLHMPGSIMEKWERGTRKRFRVTDEGTLQRLTLDGRDWPTDEVPA